MTQPNSLSHAIRVAIEGFQKLAPISIEDLRKLAGRAKSVNEEAITFLSDLPPAPSEHHYVALQLIRAAFDHGRGLLFLLESNPMDMGAPALALHRSQIENFLRGVFLGFLASAEQIEDFLENDSGIREKNHNQKWQSIGIISLAKRVEEYVYGISDEPIEDPARLSRTVNNVWTPLCGFVHGGRAVHELYIDGQGQVGGDIPVEVLVQAVCNSYVVTNFGFLVVIARIYDLEGIPVGSALHEAMQDFMRLHSIFKNRQRSSDTP